MSGRMILSLLLPADDRQAGSMLSSEEVRIISHANTGGVILFTRDYQNREQLKKLVDNIQAVKNLPIFVDHECGTVQRFKTDFTPLPPTSSHREAKDPTQSAYDHGHTMACELKQFAISSLAPVVDLDAGNKIITGRQRAFSHDPQQTTELARAYIKGMNDAAMQATLKHFPGHGQDIGDTHDIVVIDHRNYEIIEKQDLVPFATLIKENLARAIMPAHITYPKIDPDNTAGNSKIWLEDILRDKLGFDGIIISDCLSMKGSGDGSYLDKAKAALEHGDVAILCHTPPNCPMTAEQILEVLEGLGEREMDKTTEKRFRAWVGS